MQQVRNVFCVGRNYVDHARELGNDVPTTPMIFGKSTHAVAAARGHVALPDRAVIHHELEVVLWVDKPYQPGMQVNELASAVALGLDLTDREAQNRLKAAGHPWEFAKGFRNSAIVTDFYQVADWRALETVPFTLTINGKTVQTGQLRDTIFNMQRLIDYVGEHFGLDSGDVLFTGTPAGVGPVHRGDVLQLRFGDTVWGEISL
ncbi:MAG: fumarylacetoacetate hydrolase family protein [Alicyclobacillus sp.]|nr:fumarylacetoacetate hydrolase family protein [Alicyclobacillus sp.]